MVGLLPAVTAVVTLLAKVTSLEIDVTDGGYRDLLISIHKDVSYNESIVENIKTLLQRSSEFLHKATNGRVYFKQVTIDFPNTWPQRSSARRVSWSSFQKSDIRVQRPRSLHEGRPFTVQTRPCGQPGEFIQIPAEFLAELKGTTAAKYINPEYVFVHEWAHYRYGVFDEYGSQDDDTYPLTYCRDGKVKLNSCSEGIHFRATAASGEKCKMRKNCQFLKDCKVEICAPNGHPVEASIMFMPFQSNISQFCDSNKGARQHNAYAPNKQNAICKGKPTWEVISENKDFQKAPRPDMSKRIQVSFDETQQKEVLPQRIVLVLDVSGSMENNSRLEFLKEAANRYINDIPDGSKRLAIVVFSRIALVHHTMMPVNVRTRQGFLDSVDRLMHYTSTCIGCGLEKALEVLNTTDETPEGAIIVLMSDGIENEKPFIADVMPKVLEAKVEVSTLALGAEADNNLEKLATATKGKAFFFDDLQGNTALQMETAFVEATTSQADESSERFTQVMDRPISFTQRLDQKFILESTLGNNTIVLVQQVTPSSGHITAWLLDPSGQRCDVCRESASRGTKIITIPNPAKEGTWTLHLESTTMDEVEVNVQVKSQAKDQNEEPIRASCRMASLEVKKPTEAIILAEVTKGTKSVLHAEVTAEVTRPKPPHKVQVTLSDDGHGDDLDADFEYMIDDFIIHNTTSSEANETSVDEEVVDPFQRVVPGGSFQVTEEILEEQVPPGDIRDLAVTEIRPGVNSSLLLKLTWTWPRARLTASNASSVEIRASKNQANLNLDFEKQMEVTKANLIEGNLDSRPPGTEHEVTVSLPPSFSIARGDGASDWTAYLAARVKNSNGVKSETSNLVPVSYKSPPVTTTVVTTADTTTQQTTTMATTPALTTTTSTPNTTTQLTTVATTPPRKTTSTPNTTELSVAAETTPDGPTSTTVQTVEGPKAKMRLLPLWVCVLIGGLAIAIFFAIFLAVHVKLST